MSKIEDDFLKFYVNKNHVTIQLDRQYSADSYKFFNKVLALDKKEC